MGRWTLDAGEHAGPSPVLRVRVPAEILDRLDAALEDEETRSDAVREALEREVRRRERKRERE